MRHYEIMLLIHPDQSGQVDAMVAKYKKQVLDAKGKIHREENLGRRSLAYAIQKVKKAHFVLLNIETDNTTLNELRDQFRYNDAILRHLIEHTETAITEPSILALNAEKEQTEDSSEKMHKGA